MSENLRLCDQKLKIMVDCFPSEFSSKLEELIELKIQETVRIRTEKLQNELAVYKRRCEDLNRSMAELDTIGRWFGG